MCRHSQSIKKSYTDYFGLTGASTCVQYRLVTFWYSCLPHWNKWSLDTRHFTPLILASSQISDESISLKYWRLQVSLILRCCPGRSQRNLEILDCFGSSHFIGFTGMHVLHARAGLYFTRYCCCLFQFGISCKTLTQKVCLGVVPGVGRWPASVLLHAIMESGLRIKPWPFKIGVIESVNPFTLTEW